VRHAPRAPRGRRHAWACLSGAVRPERAVGAAFVLPCADAAATGLHLAEIGRHAAPGARGVVVLEGAGWHAAAGPDVPGNLILLPLPSYASELDAVENVREYPRWNKLGLRVRPDYEAIVATCARVGPSCCRPGRGRGGVGPGDEAERSGLATAHEGEHVQRAVRVGAPGGDQSLLLGAGLRGGLFPIRPRSPRQALGRSAAPRDRTRQLTGVG
jgi:hypothetical protein